MAEPVENGKPEPTLSDHRRRSRNVAIAAVLGGLVALFYAITIVKMSGTSG